MKKSLKPKSPMNTKKAMSGKLGKCYVCNMMANGSFCDRCITAGFKAKYEEAKESGNVVKTSKRKRKSRFGIRPDAKRARKDEES